MSDAGSSSCMTLHPEYEAHSKKKICVEINYC